MLAGSLLALALFAPPEPKVSQADLAAARARWQEACERMHVPGMAAVGVANGKIAFVECIGVRRAGEAAPIDRDTRFYIASVTKTFVATAAKALEEDGKLALADPVQKFLPSFTLADADAAERMTIEDLLCHRPGLSCEPVVFRDAYSGQIDDATYFALLADARPAKRVEYTNVHFTLAGRVLGAASSSTWQSVLEKRLFAPLKMTRTTPFASVLWGDANAAQAHLGVKQGAIVVPHKSDRTMHAAGGLGTTPADAARWLLFQLGDGSLDGVRVLSAAGVADLRARRSDLGSAETPAQDLRIDGFGLGWNLGTYRGEAACMHGGGYTGVICMFGFLPEKGVGAAVMLNRDSSSAMALAFTDALDLLLGRELDAGAMEALRSKSKQVDWPEPSSPGVNPAKKPGALSLDPERYAGRYENETWGTIEASFENGELRLALGDYVFTLEATGTDSFDARASATDAYAGSFEVDADTGTIEGVELRIGNARRFFEPVAAK